MIINFLAIVVAIVNCVMFFLSSSDEEEGKAFVYVMLAANTFLLIYIASMNTTVQWVTNLL